MSTYDSKGRVIPPPHEVTAGMISESKSVSAPTRAVLKALRPEDRAEGMEALVTSDRSRWVFSATSAIADTTENLALTPSVGTGRWLRADHSFTLKVPIAFGQADNATIFTVPEGFALRPAGMPYWEVTTAFAGGSSSALGVNSAKTGFTADGALLGGTGGDVEATLVAGIAAGTIGGSMDSLAELQAALFEEGDIFRVNEITDAFTSGAGFFCMPVVVTHNSPATP